MSPRPWSEDVRTALEGVYSPEEAERIATLTWPLVRRLKRCEDSLISLMYDEQVEDPYAPGSGASLPVLEAFIRLNPYARADVRQIRDALARLQAEHDARTVPPYRDGTFNQGVSAGLVLALHILTNGASCDEGECESHEQLLLTEPIITTVREDA